MQMGFSPCGLTASLDSRADGSGLRYDFCYPLILLWETFRQHLIPSHSP